MKEKDPEKERAEEKSWIPVGTPRAVNYLAAYSFRTEFNIFGPTLCPQVKNYVYTRGFVTSIIMIVGSFSASDFFNRSPAILIGKFSFANNDQQKFHRETGQI